MSIILVGTNPENTDTNNPDILIVSEEDKIGIDRAREIKKFLSLKPIGDKKQVIVLNADNLTEESQNALLKTLEEPPLNSEIILCVKDEDFLLETVRSRCQIIYGVLDSKKDSRELPEISSMTLKEKLTLAKETSTKRTQAQEFIDSLLIASKKTLIPKNIRALFRAKRMLKANTNTRLVIENLLLNW